VTLSFSFVETIFIFQLRSSTILSAKSLPHAKNSFLLSFRFSFIILRLNPLSMPNYDRDQSACAFYVRRSTIFNPLSEPVFVLKIEHLNHSLITTAQNHSAI
jgi:hypothetical protein